MFGNDLNIFKLVFIRTNLGLKLLWKKSVLNWFYFIQNFSPPILNLFSLFYFHLLPIISFSIDLVNRPSVRHRWLPSLIASGHHHLPLFAAGEHRHRLPQSIVVGCHSLSSPTATIHCHNCHHLPLFAATGCHHLPQFAMLASRHYLATWSKRKRYRRRTITHMLKLIFKLLNQTFNKKISSFLYKLR